MVRTDLFSELINKVELQRLQDGFCKVTGMCVYCLNAGGQRITEVSGTAEQRESVSKYADSAQLRHVLERVDDFSIEEQAVETLNADGGRVAAIAVRLDGKAVIYWLLFSLHYQEKKSEESFLQISDLLREFSCALFRSKLSVFSAEAECRKSRMAEEETEQTLRTVEATTKIVQLLDSDQRTEALMSEWLSILAKHLDVDTASVFRLDKERQRKDVISEWLAPGMISYFDKTRNLQLEPWLLTDKPLALSYNTPANKYRRQFKEMGMKACMVFPVTHKENEQEIILSLNHRTKKHSWETREIKFAADAVRVLQSILIKRGQRESLANSYETLETILDNMSCGIYVAAEETGESLFINKKLQIAFERELKGRTFENLLRQGMMEGKSSGSYELYYEAEKQWYDLISKKINWVDGSSAEMYSLYDITDKKIYQRRIEQQIYVDSLTGLYNRMCCERDLAKQIDKAKKNQIRGALLYLDLDDFKHINDGLGHQYGDALLKEIAHELQRTKGIEGTCYRMGGDEFGVVVSPEAYEGIDDIVDHIRQIFSKPWFLKDADYYCTMSMGIVTYPDLGDSVADLIKKVDIALHEAKKSGKNRIEKYNEKLNFGSGKRLDMEKCMRDATADDYNEFEVYYQPIIDLEGGKQACVGAEALIRWNSSRLGFIPPDEFIPLAEYLGLINPIGAHVLKEACIQCKKWNESGYPDYKVNVNLSVIQLLQADVVELVERAIEETGIAPRNLTLEVTESLAINDMERMKRILGRIKMLGVRIALDDFGTGYSSLNRIREIPLDVIKVDQSFVKGLVEDAYSQSFVRMVAELAKALGVNICVEGIENQLQYEVVRSMEVKYAQGYHFARPMKRDEFEKKYCNPLLQN